MKINEVFGFGFMENISLRKRILIMMISLVLITTVFLGTTIYRFSKDTIEENYHKAHLNNLAVSSKMMDIYLDKVIEEGRTLLENTKFIQIMETESSGSSYFSTVDQLALDNVLGDISSHNFLVNGIMVVSESGSWRYFSKSNVYSGYLKHFYTTDNLLEEPWISVAKEAKGKEVFYPYDVILGDRARDCFCLVKNLINPYTQESFGYLSISIDKRIWKESFGKDNEGYATNRYMVMLTGDRPEEDKVVFFNGLDEERDAVLAALNNTQNATFLFSSFINETTGWSIMNIITKDELEKDSDYIQKILVLGIVLMTCISLLAANAISRRITKPLNILAESITKVEVGNLKVETVFDKSEVGMIGNRFKSLVNNNLELRDRLLNLEIKEKEAQLLLLQSQINPHFLYNTLDALYFMAIIEQSDDIADMVQALSNIFKRSLNQGDKLISLRDEIEHMKDYMKIQNLRFSDRYTLHIHVEEALLDKKILSFMLQPILENAVYHGLESKTEPGNIFFTGELKEGKLMFTLRDDGIGNDDLSAFDKGYGVKNIKERINLYYGNQYTMTIESGKCVGTTVSFVIPLESV